MVVDQCNVGIPRLSVPGGEIRPRDSVNRYPSQNERQNTYHGSRYSEAFRPRPNQRDCQLISLCIAEACGININHFERGTYQLRSIDFLRCFDQVQRSFRGAFVGPGSGREDKSNESQP